MGNLTMVFNFFLALGIATVANGLKHGQLRLGRSTPEGYYCETVTFPSAFSGYDPVKVFTSVSHGPISTRVHDVTFTWVESVTTSDFRVCLVESGTGSNGNATVNWIAYQGTESGVAEGTVTYTDWTTGTKCNRVPFQQVFSRAPQIFAAVRHNILNRKQDAASVWIEGMSRSEFTICLREFRAFDGRHEDIEVGWMAFASPPTSWSLKEVNKIYFPNSLTPREEDNDAFCQVINFSNPFFTPPSIVLTARHTYDSSNVNAVPPECNSIVTWIEEVTSTYFRACVKDLVGLNSKEHPITVGYIVAGDLDPCINKSCNYFAICRAFSPSDAQCVCISECPSYEDLVCATNGQTFDNLCIMKREVCIIMGNFTYYHPGGCQGFPLAKGRHDLSNNPSWVESHCEMVQLQPYTFYPDKPVHVQLTVNYFNSSQSSKVHEATVSWVERVDNNNFTMCVTKTGRNDNRSPDFASVDWMAYQGAPNGGVSGRERFSRWWTGTNCRTLTLPSGKFSGSPTILVTLEHERIGLKHDAASFWVEDASSTSFKICLRELQDFDGLHEDITANWIAFETLHRPLFSEHGSVHFSNNHLPLKSNNYAFCKVVGMSRNYTDEPIVMVTAAHETGGGNSDPQCNGIYAWIEAKSKASFRLCIKELYTSRHDPVTVHYAVVSDACGDGWSYFNGFCYKTTSSCESWQSANAMCLDQTSNLTSVHSKEENVYVQHLHGGGTGWIGLQDIESEGNFTWTDDTMVNFTAWADHQPNGYLSSQDCVHSLGVNHKYEWNDVTCSACHGFSCKRDHNECFESIDECDPVAQCVNTKGAYSCICPAGYTKSGYTCNDIDECSDGTDLCDTNSVCTNTVGSYTCQCNSGYSGNGRTCSDIDECSDGTDLCDTNSVCTNTVGSYTCQCNSGYSGNGRTCSDYNECISGSHRCHSDAQCMNNAGSYSCRCNSGHHGNGYSCSDVNECGGSHGCHANAQCINTPGSYICRCNSGFYGNGTQCTVPIVRFGTRGHSGRSGSVQTFRVMTTGRYLIQAGGAHGGTHSYNYGFNPGTYYGGQGASMQGTFRLSSGSTLNIVVGQRGGNSVEVKGGRSTTQTAAQLGQSVEDNAGTGGGGGSFVYTTSNTLLLAAGGGGGASSGYNGVDGRTGQSGTSSIGYNSGNARGGGTGGNPGQCNSAGGNYHGGVGAGWNGQGCTRLGPDHGERGGSRSQGWIGGRAGSMNSGYNGGPPPGAVGGFGGGGGGSEDNGASGGGGGYSGGGSGMYERQAGGGGGSYCSGSGCSGVTGGNSNGNGFVEIAYVGN